LQTGRTVDFYYEHNSHFTTESFTRMLQRCASSVDRVCHGYHGEVISGLATLGGSRQAVVYAREAEAFHEAAREGLTTVAVQLDELHASGRRIAIWGGTGKAAAFINHYQVDAARFPLVVDSDQGKVGTHVPGAGQKIQWRDHLRTEPVEVIIIPMQWRARDILHEIQAAGIRCEQVLIEHQGRLIDFHRDEHPY
jgi:hypothetical protein